MPGDSHASGHAKGNSMMSRKAMVWWGAGAAAAVALGVLLFHTPSEKTHADPGPKPAAGVPGKPENGPLPPIFDDGDPAVAVGVVGSDWTSFLVDDGEGTYEWVDVEVGQSATLEGVTIALCAVWYNPGGDVDEGPDSVGAPLVNPSMAYFLLSRDGSTPVCP
jgi:hypothetical protein